jgi:hypothetical protein
MPRRSDIWRSAIVAAPMQQLLATGLAGHQPLWLPATRPFTFDADPFGIWRNDHLFVFVENYDYRVRIGGIDVLCYDRQLQLQWRKTCLREAWHLSYPFVFEDGGQTWMLPESHRSGALRLYRAVDFPLRWQVATTIELDCVPVDATPVRFEDRWWLFYSPATSKRDKIGMLHVAYADELAGPWHAHPANPVRVDLSSSRPGGTPLVVDGQLVVPMQDCRQTYGGAIRPLHVQRLTTTAFDAEAGGVIAAPAHFAPYVEGLHTLSACGAITLVDAKFVDRSLQGLAIGARRQLQRLGRALGLLSSRSGP